MSTPLGSCWDFLGCVCTSILRSEQCFANTHCNPKMKPVAQGRHSVCSLCVFLKLRDGDSRPRKQTLTKSVTVYGAATVGGAPQGIQEEEDGSQPSRA